MGRKRPLPEGTKFIGNDFIERTIIYLDDEEDFEEEDFEEDGYCAYYVDIPFEDGGDFFEHGSDTYFYILHKGTITNLKIKKDKNKDKKTKSINEEVTYRGFMSVDYDDGDASSFRGLILQYGDNTKNFNTGDPLLDWYDYKKFVYNGDAAKKGIFSIGHSSSVYHWFMDTDEYIEKYLKETETGFEFINREDVNKLSFDQMDHSIKCVVSKDMKSFEELKQYYRLNKPS